VDVSAYSESRLELLKFYSSELGEPPFPRSKLIVRSLAQVRGAQSGFDFAEGFMLIRERRWVGRLFTI